MAEGWCALKSGFRVQARVSCRVKGVGGAGIRGKRPAGVHWQREAPGSSSPRATGPCWTSFDYIIQRNKETYTAEQQ